MAALRFVRKYVKALMDLASAAGVERVVHDDLKRMDRWFREAETMRQIVIDPRVSGAAKKSAMEKALPSDFLELTRHFVLLVLERGRSEILPDVFLEYEDQLRERLGIVQVEVTSAVELGSEQRDWLIAEIKARTGKEVELLPKLDARLLGGMRVRIGSMLYDGSLRRRLHEVRGNLLAVSMPP